MPAPRRLAGHGAADLARELAGLARGQPLGQRRRRHVQRRELLDEEGDPLRLGLLVDAIQGRDARAARSSWATRSLVRIIRCSISLWASVWGTERAPVTAPSASKLNSGSNDSISSDPTGRRAASAAAARRARPSGSATSGGG